MTPKELHEHLKLAVYLYGLESVLSTLENVLVTEFGNGIGSSRAAKIALARHTIEKGGKLLHIDREA